MCFRFTPYCFWQEFNTPAHEPIFHQGSSRASSRLVPNLEPLFLFSAEKYRALGKRKWFQSGAGSFRPVRKNEPFTSGAGGGISMTKQKPATLRTLLLKNQQLPTRWWCTSSVAPTGNLDLLLHGSKKSDWSLSECDRPEVCPITIQLLLTGPPLTKCYLWALWQMDTWNKANRSGKRCSFHVTSNQHAKPLGRTVKIVFLTAVIVLFMAAM